MAPQHTSHENERTRGGHIVRGDMGATGPMDASTAETSASTMFAVVDPLFRGRALAIELGCGDGAMILAFAETFVRLRAVDPDPGILVKLEERAARLGIDNFKAFLIDQAWDEPTGAADYVFARDLFVRVEDLVESANYLQRISMALHSGGIAQLRFDTSRRDFGDWLRQRTPDRFRARSERPPVPPVRRVESWVRDRVRGADLEIVGERGPGTSEHWVVARRR
jgi:hypothetical protein